jgi:hypothetical protein
MNMQFAMNNAARTEPIRITGQESRTRPITITARKAARENPVKKRVIP